MNKLRKDIHDSTTLTQEEEDNIYTLFSSRLSTLEKRVEDREKTTHLYSGEVTFVKQDDVLELIREMREGE